jgi:hypothetical protein
MEREAVALSSEEHQRAVHQRTRAAEKDSESTVKPNKLVV